MLKKFRRPSPSIIIACIALFAATAGTATAARLISGKQIRNNSITGTDVKNKSLSPSDFRGSVAGERGPAGPAGAAGAPGAPGLAGVHQVDGPSTSYPPGAYGGSARAQCPPGEVVIGTGFNGPMGDPGVFVKAYGTFVGGFFVNDSSITVDGSVQATCARTSGALARAASSGRAEFQRDIERAAARIR